MALGLVLAACETTSQTGGDVGGQGGAESGIFAVPSGTIEDKGLNAQPRPDIEWVQFECGDRLWFAYDSADLTPEGQQTIEGWAEWLRLFPDSVPGYRRAYRRPCRRARHARVQTRARRKARQCRPQSPDRVPGRPVAGHGVVSFGKERPVETGHTEQAWSKNRRGVLTII